MQTSRKGIDLIKHFEGFRSRMYHDPTGLPTIGYGTLIDTAEEQYLLTAVITELEAELLLIKELHEIEPRLIKLLQKPVNQNQFDALADFCYNFGTTPLKRSTLLRKVNVNPSDPTIRDEFAKWIYIDGVVSTWQISRRKAEADLYFLTPLDMT